MMKTKLIAGLTVFVLAIAGTACGNGNSGEQASPPTSTEESDSVVVTAEYHKISAAEAQEMIAESEEFILLDVRTDEEFREKRIDGAVLIPDYEIQERAETELPDKEALILIYCRSGRRSAAAANELVNMGYTNVYDFGGIIDWPYDTVSDEQ